MQRGLTLLELLIVLLVFSLLLGLGGLGWGRVIEAYRLRSAAHLLAGQLEEARSLAVTHNQTVRILVDESGRSFGQALSGRAPLRWRSLPEGVRAREVPRNPVSFHSRGSAVPAGSYLLANGSGRARVVVALPGRVRWEFIE